MTLNYVKLSTTSFQLPLEQSRFFQRSLLLSRLISRVKYLFAILSRRLVWFLPKNKTIAILDEGGSDYLVQCLGSTDYFIIARRSDIYIKYFLMAIFDTKLKVRDLRYFYFTRILDRLNPVLVITNIDNNPDYYRLDKGRTRGKFLTVQNGNHFVNKPYNLPKEYDHFFLRDSPYFSNLACISQYDADYYSKMGVDCEKYYPIGSIHSSQHMVSFSKSSKKFDLCIIVNSFNARPANIKLWEFILKYIETYDVSVCMALKKNSSHNGFYEHIKGLEKFFSCSNVEIVERDTSSSQHASDISEVTIGAWSTILRHTFARGNKIYPINFAHKSISPPYDLLGYPLDPTYEEFQTHLDYLLAMDQKAYSDRYKELMAYLDIFCPKNPPLKKLESIIQGLVSEGLSHMK